MSKIKFTIRKASERFTSDSRQIELSTLEELLSLPELDDFALILSRYSKPDEYGSMYELEIYDDYIE